MSVSDIYLHEEGKAEVKKIIKEILAVWHRHQSDRGPWYFGLAIFAMAVALRRETANRIAAGDEDAEDDQVMNDKLAEEIASEIDKPLASA